MAVKRNTTSPRYIRRNLHVTAISFSRNMSSCRTRLCGRIVAARHKTGAAITTFLRKACSERYALISPLNEFECTRISLPMTGARYNENANATYRSAAVIGANDKDAILPHFVPGEHIFLIFSFFLFFRHVVISPFRHDRTYSGISDANHNR